MASRLTDNFIPIWDWNAQHTLRLLKALPVTKYDFRPDPEGRSLGELAWHLAEIDGYMSFGLETRRFEIGVRPPGIERPRTIEALPPAYERVHAEAVARVRKLGEEDLKHEITFFDGRPLKPEDILWVALLHHSIHHRGQLAMMCRLAGGTPPGIYGPNREEMGALKARG